MSATPDHKDTARAANYSGTSNDLRLLAGRLSTDAIRALGREAVLEALEHDLAALAEQRGERAESAVAAVAALRACTTSLREAVMIGPVLRSAASAGDSLRGLPELCAELFSHVRIPEQLSQGSLDAAARSYLSLFAPGAPAELRRAHFPQLAAMALNREALRSAPGGESISLLGDILALLPMEAPRRSIRDLLLLIDDRCRIEDLRLLRGLLASETTQDGLLMAFRIFTSALANLRSLRDGAWEECREMTTKALANGFKGARACMRSFEELVAANIPEPALRCFAAAAPELARERPDILHGRVAANVARSWMIAPPPASSCRSFLAGTSRAPVDSTTVRLARLTDASLERVPYEEVFWPALESLCGVEHFRPLAPERHELHRRLSDLHRGFYAALKHDLTRLPGETVSPLCRAALEVGDVQLVHSSDRLAFPGPGLALSNLDLSKILVADELRPDDPFHRYKETWPGIAKELDKLSGLGLVVTPGLLIIQPPASMRLQIGRRQGRHYSLCVFSEEAGDPSLVKALLVDSAWLRRRVSPCLKEWRPEWFEGAPEQAAQSISAMSLRPEQILARNTARDIIAIDIGSPLTHLAGYAYGLAPGTSPLFSLSVAPPDSAPMTTFGHVVMTAADISLDKRRSLFRAQARVDIDLVRYTAETLNFIDAFRLVHAVLHKGLGGHHGVGVDYSIRDKTAPPMPVAQPRLPAASGQPNPAQVALGPLVDALKWHRALAREGSSPQPSDPMLVTAPALTYSQPPDGEFVLDIRTLECRVDTFDHDLFPAGRPRITREVRKIWLEELLPRLSDTFVDLRVVTREQLQRALPPPRGPRLDP